MSPSDWGLLLAAALLLGAPFCSSTFAEIDRRGSENVAAPICWAMMRTFGVRLPRTRRRPGIADGGDPLRDGPWGQQHIESGMAGILFGTMPVMAVVLAPLFLAEESFTRRRLIGALIGLAGIVLVMGSVLGNVGDQALAIFITFLGPLATHLARSMPAGSPASHRPPWPPQ